MDFSLYQVMVAGEGVCIHLKIYQSFTEGGELSVTGIKFPTYFDDPLIPL